MKLHVFLADDDQEELEMFLEAIATVNSSFKCTYATNGKQAIEMLRYLVPDFIFVDYNMDKISGLDILTAIKGYENLKHVPSFLYSSHMSQETKQKAFALGAASCIEKSGTIKELSEKLRDAIQVAINSNFAQA